MPELPEVETIRRQLAPQLIGSRIVSSWAGLARITHPNIRAFVKQTQGRRVVDARRHGKQLYFPLDSGWNLLVHLGMSGRLQVESADFSEAGNRHVHAVLRLEGGSNLVYEDPRTFGMVGVEPDLGFLSKMGPDPMAGDFDAEALVAEFSGRTAAIKSLLLNQALVAGVGNIYADEVCYLASVHPARRSHTISRKRLREVVSHIQPVLRRGIEANGATLKDGGYQDLFGEAGLYRPYVYGRTGEPCDSCGTAIRRGVLGSSKSARSYHFCPRCQKR